MGVVEACPCECSAGAFCGGCGHAGCGMAARMRGYDWPEARVAKRHDIYVIVDAAGLFIGAYLSYSEASRELRPGQRIVTVHSREDY